jgi:plasmid maintenance system antidote protein VapI|tara:strand:- start:1735 stop:2583 length:849 start_codon:yes stop_codon:yes gene_type:complete
MKKIYIYHHLGLGDHISCNGFVRSILKKNRNHLIYLFCKKQYLKLISFLYRDEKKIRLIPIDVKNKSQKIYEKEIELYLKKIKKKNKIYKIGFEKFNDIYEQMYSYSNPVSHEMVFYHQLKLPYSKRFSESYWKRDFKNEDKTFRKLVKNNKNNFAFIHDEPSLGYFIDSKFVTPGLKIVRNDKRENIFHMAKILEEAKELHLMESSFRCMAETLNIKTKNIYLYIWRRRKIAPNYSRKLNKVIGAQKNWKIVLMNPKQKNLKFHIMNSLLRFRFYILSLIN